MSVAFSGLFAPNDFRNRGLLRLAPDGFVTINGALGARVLSPVNTSGKSGLEIRGGITSMSVNMALSPPGSSKATLEVIAPQYKGLHEDYYITLPNGTRVPYFAPMMEVKIYMKGRFLDESSGYRPQYYPVFWGLITEVSENYSGGVNTFSINCQDMLSWWKYQKITMNPAAIQSVFGAPARVSVPTVFENMSPWEVIYALFMDNFFADKDGRSYNFIYPKFSTAGLAPDFSGVGKSSTAIGETFNSLTKDVIKYWNNRFGFGVGSSPDDPNRAPLEMFGLQGPIQLDSVRQAVSLFRNTARTERSSSIVARLNLDFGLLARIQPYGAFNLYGDGASSMEMTKLEIANEVCEQTHMEFFIDTNGKFVFKPPLYNLDVNSESLPYYVFKPEDIIAFNSSVNGDAICNFLEVTAPMRYEVPAELENIGYHIDYDSIKRYGIRYQHLPMRYGNDARSLRLVACAEMSRINGRAYTGSLSTPLRPELRLGYPVYVKHLDAYFYVTSISHSLSFGTSATTDIGLETRRDRMWDDGSVTGVPGRLLKAKVLRYDPKTTIGLVKKTDKKKPQATTDEKVSDWVEQLRVVLNNKDADYKEMQLLVNNILKEDFKRSSGILAGPKTQGLYVISDASIKYVDSNKIGDFVGSNQKKMQEKAKAGTERTSDEKVTDPQSEVTKLVVSNELLMITDDTVPYADRLGYRHIGAFPYGGNLKLTRGNGIMDVTNPSDRIAEEVDTVVNASGTGKPVSTKANNEGKTQHPYTPMTYKEIDLKFTTAPADSTSVANNKNFDQTVKANVDAAPLGPGWDFVEVVPGSG